jgi:diacylglycerol O-acyltransferase-1
MDVYEDEVRARRRSLIKSGAASETPQNSPREKLARLHKEQDSLLSTASGFDNYRGLLHLGGILLVLSTFRVALDNLIKYGVLASPITWFEAFIGDPSRWPCTLLVFTLNGYIIAALLLEKAMIKRLLSNMTACLLYVMILASVLIVPTSAVLILAPNPFASAVALSLHTITFLKLFSYMVVNNSFRQNSREKQLIIKEGHEKEGNKDDQHTIYPENVNIKDIYYFMYAPTLCYELNFPRNARIRKRYLLKRLTEVVVLSSILLALGQQWLVPTIQNSMQPFKELEYSRFAERVLKLAVSYCSVILVN